MCHYKIQPSEYPQQVLEPYHSVSLPTIHLFQLKLIKFIKHQIQSLPYFGMGKNAKSYATNTPLSIFSLGKGRESLRLKPYKKL